MEMSALKLLRAPVCGKEKSITPEIECHPPATSGMFHTFSGFRKLCSLKLNNLFSCYLYILHFLSLLSSNHSFFSMLYKFVFGLNNNGCQNE